jgi:hypothetical protein
MGNDQMIQWPMQVQIVGDLRTAQTGEQWMSPFDLPTAPQFSFALSPNHSRPFLLRPVLFEKFQACPFADYDPTIRHFCVKQRE